MRGSCRKRTPTFALRLQSSSPQFWAPAKLLPLGLGFPTQVFEFDGAVSQLEHVSFTAGHGLVLHFSAGLQRRQSISVTIWFSGDLVHSSSFWHW
jgi:hypothetical protein